MQLVHTACAASHGFILSTGHVKAADKLQYYLKEKADEYRRSNWVAVIVKISDESAGCVHPDGTFAKPMTASDRRKLDAGGRAAKEFLLAIGAREDSIVKREGIYGGHNGASAAIGTVVDANLATEADGLFICDSSVLPTAPGMPPILTILALAKRLGRALT
jgi:hypothetical protein